MDVWIVLVVIILSGVFTFLLYREKLKTMNTVEPMKNANSYVVNNSFNLTYSRDVFLYTNIVRTKVGNSNNRN